MPKNNRTATRPSPTSNVGDMMDQAEEKTRQISQDVVEYLTDYVREHPERAALWCLGIGFVLGWKLKPW